MSICSTPELDKLLELLPEPKNVFKHFLNVTQVPRGSNPDQSNLDNSTKIIAALTSWAEKIGCEYYVDKGKNVLIKKPGSPGCENLPPVCIQCHMDMVCEAEENVKIDFKTQPITPWIENNTYLRAKGTSLGADDGIGIGSCFAILEDKSLIHPPIEVLVTRDEETGLYGAADLEPGILKSNNLINVDSEEQKKVCIGCAGGFTYKVSYKIIRDKSCPKYVAKKVVLRGLNGGHSGVNIHLGRINALSMVGRLLAAAKSVEYRICGLNSGTAHNAIPREATIIVSMPQGKENNFTKAIMTEFESVKVEYAKIEPNASLEITDVPYMHPFNAVDTSRLVNFLNTVVCGPIRWSPDVEGLVDTSNTLGVCNVTDNAIEIFGSCRAFADSQLTWMYTWVKSFCDMCDFKLSEKMGAYPGWKPEPESELNLLMIEETKKAYGEDPVVYAIHAGLECGLFMGKYPGMKCTSIGPTIDFPHSPQERLLIKSVLPFYTSLVKTIERLAKV